MMMKFAQVRALMKGYFLEIALLLEIAPMTD